MPIVLLALLLIGMLVLPTIVTFSMQIMEGGVGAVVFRIELYDERGKPHTDILGRQVTPKDLMVYAQVFAITSPDDAEVITEVFKGEVRSLTLKVEARGRFKEVIDRWVEFEERRGTLAEDSGTALQLNLWFINKTSGDIVQRVSYYYHYSPKIVKDGKEVTHVVKVAIPRKGGKTTGDLAGVKPQEACYYWYEWRPKYKVMPENYTTGYGNYIRYHNGAYYVTTPVLAIFNTHSQSGPLGGSIIIRVKEVTKWYVSIGIGLEIEKKLKNKDIASVIASLNGNVYFGGVTREYKADFYRQLDTIIGAWREAYVYIWARPILIFYDEYYVEVCPFYYEKPTGNQRADFFIQDVIVIPKGDGTYMLDGGTVYGPLPDFIRRWIFNDTLTEWRYLTFLNPNSGHSLGFLLDQYIDTCNANLEIPIGTLLAVALAFKLPWLAPLAVLIAPNIGYSDSAEIFVEGGIQNGGSKTEYLWVRVSKVQYRKDPPWWCFWCSPCYFKVPIAMYFVSD